ncbi:MAG: Gfo/Idh/MocA family oxidoreductase, partial [Chloroflexota bacterium]
MQFKISSLASSGARNYYKRVITNALVDILIVIIAYTVAISAWALDTPIDVVASAWLVLFVAVIMVVTSHFFGVYRRIWARTSGHGITVILNAVLVATVIIVPVILLTKQNPLPLPIVLLGNLLSLGGFIAVRYRSRLASSVVWRWKAALGQEFPRQGRRVLIIGAGESGQALAWRLMHRFNHGDYKVVGFIDDDPEKQNMYVEGCRIIGTRKDIVRISDVQNIDLIVVAIHNISGPDFREVLAACENTKALIKVVPDLEALV